MTAAEIMALIRASEKRFYCYVLRRPDGEPFYVGAGHGQRILDHARRDTRRGAKGSLIRRILGETAEADYSISAFFETWDEAADEECRLIAFYGRRDLGLGPLANATSGGDGTPGIVWRQETLDKRSAALKGRPVSDEQRAFLNEIRKLASLDQFIEAGRQWRKENREELIAERRERWDKPGVRERHIEAMADPDTRKAMSEAMNARLADPTKRQKLVDAVRAARGQPVLINGISYPTIREAAEALGVNQCTVSDRLRRKVFGYERLK